MSPRERDHTEPAVAEPATGTADRLDARALAAARREATRARARRIRRFIAGTALALFAAAFLAIYVQLASGHDPALSRHATASAVESSSTASGSTGESSGEASGSGEGSGTGESGSTESTPAEGEGGETATSESTEPSPVQTGQS